MDERAAFRRAQPIAGFCHHGMRSAQVVAFVMQPERGGMYNLAGCTTAGPRP